MRKLPAAQVSRLLRLCYVHGCMLSVSCRGVYNGRTWEERLLQRETKRQLVNTKQHLEDRAWAEQDDVLADIAGRKRQRISTANLAEARKVF